MQTYFDQWNHFKKHINITKNYPTFKEREIWWCSLGINIGHEQNGKGEKFHRPVLVIKKFNHRLFWGVPLTTQIKEIPHYYNFIFQKRKQCAMLTQMRLWDAVRISRRMGRLAEEEYKNIQIALKSYLM